MPMTLPPTTQELQQQLRQAEAINSDLRAALAHERQRSTEYERQAAAMREALRRSFRLGVTPRVQRDRPA